MQIPHTVCKQCKRFFFVFDRRCERPPQPPSFLLSFDKDPSEKQRSHLHPGTGQRGFCATDHGHLALLCQFLQLVGLVLRFYESLLHIFQRLSRQEGCEKAWRGRVEGQEAFSAGGRRAAGIVLG